MRNLKKAAIAVAAYWFFAAAAFAGIDTDAIQKPWVKQSSREYEVGRFPVRWRHKLVKKEGLFSGVSFIAPATREAVWDLAADYSGVGKVTPGIKAVRVREEGNNRQVIEVDIKVLWKSMTLAFEVEQDPPAALRFRWQDKRFGEFKGVAVFSEAAASKQLPSGGTRVELSTQFHPYHPAPLRLLLGFHRMAMLSAARGFLEGCEAKGGV